MLSTLLTTRRSINAAGNSPFDEILGCPRKISRTPGRSQIILIREILGAAATGTLEIPEQRRRDGMTARPDLGLPTLTAHREPTADNLVKVAHRKGDMVDAGLIWPSQ